MEYLTFSQRGQWSLHKALLHPPKDEGKPSDEPYKVYNRTTLEGQLHEDTGTRGELHDFGQGKRPKQKGKMNPRTAAKVPHRVDSVYEEYNPGYGL